MASTKIMSLVIRTLSKPISNKLKTQAQEHPWFRERVLSLAQFMHRFEMKMRTGLLRDPTAANVHVRPLNEAKAIQDGANFISEAFLFSVGLGLILGESYRGYRKDAHRRTYVDDQLDSLSEQVEQLSNRIQVTNQALLGRLKETEERSEETRKLLEIMLRSSGLLSVDVGERTTQKETNQRSVERP